MSTNRERLPLPEAHDLDCYFDLEGDPLLGGPRGREYLWGIAHRENGTLAFDARGLMTRLRGLERGFVESHRARFEE